MHEKILGNTGANNHYHLFYQHLQNWFHWKHPMLKCPDRMNEPHETLNPNPCMLHYRYTTCNQQSNRASFSDTM